MDQRSDTAVLQRWLPPVAVALAAVVYGPTGGLDGIGISKSTAVVLVAAVAIATAVAAVVRGRTIVLPRNAAIVAAAVFAVLMVVRAVLGENLAIAFGGPLGRANGVVLYLACVVLFVVAASRSGMRAWEAFARVATVAGAIVALAIIDEVTIGIGPQWAARPGAAGTLGNGNFSSSWTACLLPILVVAACERSWSRPWRIAAATSAALLAVALPLGQSLQGGYVVAACAAMMVLVVTSERLAPARWRQLAVGIGVLGLVGGVLTIAGAVGAGPLRLLGEQIGVRLRVEYWLAAARMFADEPLTGVGIGRYIDHYRLTRSVEGANLVDLESTSDSAHNVPLHLFAEGGVLVGAAYLAVVVLVAVALVVGLRRTSGRERLWLGAVGAAWVGYTLQSIISIDVASLAVLGWVLAGYVVGAATSAVFRVDLARASVVVRGSVVTAVALLAVVSVVGAALFIVPSYRADVASAGAIVERQRTPDGRTATSRAVELAPWQPGYHSQLAGALLEEGEVERASGTLERGLERVPDAFSLVVTSARIATASNDRALAEERYERAIELEPNHVDLLVEAAEYVVRGSQVDLARTWLDRALEIDPDNEEAQRLRAPL